MKNDRTEHTHPRLVAAATLAVPGYYPPGYTPPNSVPTTSRGKTPTDITPAIRIDTDTLKMKKAWELAYSPAKSIPLNLFMSYMTGNSLQVIPLTMALMLLWNPLSTIANLTNSTFAKLKTASNSSQILLAKGVFVVGHVACMLIGLYKFYKMGLIPHTEADWLAWKSEIAFREIIG